VQHISSGKQAIYWEKHSHGRFNKNQRVKSVSFKYFPRNPEFFLDQSG